MFALAPDVVAIGGVEEAAGNCQLAIQRKQQRQACRRARVDGLVLAGPIPGAAQAIVAFGPLAQGLGRRMVQEAAQRQIAPVAVQAGVQDERMPHGIHRLGRHGHELPARAAAGIKILAQAALDQIDVLGRQVGVLCAHLALEKQRQRPLADPAFAPARNPKGQDHRPGGHKENWHQQAGAEVPGIHHPAPQQQQPEQDTAPHQPRQVPAFAEKKALHLRHGYTTTGSVSSRMPKRS